VADPHGEGCGASDAVRELSSLVSAARQGDADALGRLLEVFRPYLLKVAEQDLPGALRGKCGGSDLVQETLLEAHRDFAGREFRGPDDIRAWLKSILKHNLADQVRRYIESDKRSVERERPLPSEIGTDLLKSGIVDQNPTPGARVVAREEAAAVDAAVDRLPPDEQAVILYRNRDHLGWDEIGLRLDRSGEAARKLWSRAIDRLRRELGDS
jgi:RNA polymerase sigma-70 factor, ECF subfamily